MASFSTPDAIGRMRRPLCTAATSDDYMAATPAVGRQRELNWRSHLWLFGTPLMVGIGKQEQMKQTRLSPE